MDPAATAMTISAGWKPEQSPPARTTGAISPAAATGPGCGGSGECITLKAPVAGAVPALTRISAGFGLRRALTAVLAGR